MTFDAIVLCGGSSTRLGDDKALVEVGGATLLDRALDAVAGAQVTIAVGPRRDTARSVVWTIEDPAGGGPVAGIAAGLDLTKSELVVVLGVDFPFVDAARVTSVVGSVGRHDGAILRDATGRHQFLIGAYRSDPLRKAIGARDPNGMAVKELIAGMDIVVLDDPRSTFDVDTRDDLEEARRSTGSGS